MSDTSFDPKRSRWIPWAFVGGMALVFAVNAVLVVKSVSTFTGVVVDRAYEQGRQYNQVIAEAARQDALGWRAAVELHGGALDLRVSDADGRPVTGRIEGVLRRPLEGTEVPLMFASRGGGRWRAEVTPPEAGQWEARLTLFGPGDTPFDIRQRVMVR